MPGGSGRARPLRYHRGRSRRRPVGKRDSSGAEVDRRRAHAKTHVERQRVVPVLPAKKVWSGSQVALEHLLGERRPVVGRCGSSPIASLTVEASLAQRLRRAQAARARRQRPRRAAWECSRFDRKWRPLDTPARLVHLLAQTLRGRLVQDAQYAVVALSKTSGAASTQRPWSRIC